VPADNLLAVGNTPVEAAALIEPFAIGLHAVRRAKVERRETVLVVGAGPIGLIVAAISKIYGAKVVVAETSEVRRSHAEDTLDLTVIDPSIKNMNARLSEIFGGTLPSTIIDATGNPAAMNNSINLVCHGGTIVFVGLHKGDIVIPNVDFHRKEITLMGSRNATYSDFELVQSLMTSGKISADIILNKSLSFSSLVDEFEPQIINNKHLIKAIVHFN
jgi:2-desacetyl-2-hydroxyethyl bacteriochlorophyllide A dehydrogenase